MRHSLSNFLSLNLGGTKVFFHMASSSTYRRKQILGLGAQGQTGSAGSGGVISRTCGSSADPSRQIFEVDFSGRALEESDTDGFKNIISQCEHFRNVG
ncbi:hypothetical protein F3Y22_tig00008957pilonHSYRG00157 [Hibiscus syriacus]|uniref:Uncharacterized protein n=1 Tax=Hibiscus syriacus TaxID=106335 RepID=A0A6A3CD56_HIBSY|nr:hypothetical protein F3Y22_tig00008957pilonHSYRG00157 [Hibiscus syriacus]